MKVNNGFEFCKIVGENIVHCSRFIRLTSSLVWILLMMLLIPLETRAADDPNNARDIIRDILKNMKVVKQPASGRGTATVKIQNVHETRIEVVEFTFKDDSTRSDHFFITDDGQRGRCKIRRALNRDYYVSFSFKRHSALVSPKPRGIFNQKLGYDFHPKTFIGYHHHGRNIAETLDRAINGPASFSLHTDPNGILSITVTYKDEKVNEYSIIAVDLAKECRLISEYYSMEFINDPNRSFTKSYEVQWKQYDSIWYPKSAKWEVLAGPPSNRVQKETVEVKITEFQPNIEIENVQFTFEGLKIPEGTEVRDEIKGIEYIVKPK